MDVCLLIKSRLEELGLEQKDLAAAAEVTESYVSQLLNRKKLPPACGGNAAANLGNFRAAAVWRTLTLHHAEAAGRDSGYRPARTRKRAMAPQGRPSQRPKLQADPGHDPGVPGHGCIQRFSRELRLVPETAARVLEY